MPAQAARPALGFVIAIDRAPPREQPRAGLERKEEGVSRKCTSQGSILLDKISLSGGFGRQIAQLTTEDFDGLRRRAHMVVVTDVRTFVDAEAQ